jgi:hypothetical protein
MNVHLLNSLTKLMYVQICHFDSGEINVISFHLSSNDKEVWKLKSQMEHNKKNAEDSKDYVQFNYYYMKKRIFVTWVTFLYPRAKKDKMWSS